ncbi:hypothetical protein [Rhodococcus wratislaviensis]|uniref:hypothetical protein n=1 Tax=Rhodococcus wratislaviensis TaxID=44752 RepID=UPI0036620495
MTKGAADSFGGGGVVAASAVGGLADAHSSLLTKLVLAAVAGSFRFAMTLAAWLAPPVAVTAATVWVVLIQCSAADALVGPCRLRRTVSMTYGPRATEPRAQHSKPGQAGDTR